MVMVENNTVLSCEGNCGKVHFFFQDDVPKAVLQQFHGKTYFTS